jgi:hypothetical protein
VLAAVVLMNSTAMGNRGRLAVHTAERMAERYVHLILAKHGYVRRLARPHPVVPNTADVPDVPAPPDDGRRVVYVGHLSPDRAPPR